MCFFSGAILPDEFGLGFCLTTATFFCEDMRITCFEEPDDILREGEGAGDPVGDSAGEVDGD